MPVDETTKWLKKVEMYNAKSEKQIDPKADPLPGPNAYTLPLEWKGKVTKKNKNIPVQPHLLDTISRGPVINAYYKKI